MKSAIIRAVLISSTEQRLLTLYGQGEYETVLRELSGGSDLTSGESAILGASLAARGDYNEAVRRSLAAVGPEAPLWAVTLGSQTLFGLGHHEEATHALESRYSDPDLSPEYLVTLSIASVTCRGLDRVHQVMATMVEHDDGRNRLIWGAAQTAIQLGDMPLAWQYASQGLTRYRDDFEGLRLAVFLSSYLPEFSPEAIRTAAERLGRLIQVLSTPLPGSIPNNRNPDRRLRLGFVSPDLRRHVVADFCLDLIRHLDRDEFAVSLYSIGTHHDEVTDAFAETADHFREMPNAMWDQLAARIRADKIDVLVDLAGHTEGGAPAVAAYRAAPVNVTYLGSPTTTGVPGMDARFVDAVTDPAGEDALVTERLVRLPAPFLCYRPTARLAPIDVRPAGPVVFGCFGNPAKISHETCVAWREILERVEGSRLQLTYHTYARQGVRETMEERLSEAGIDLSRCEIGVGPPDSILPAYGRIDVALDTFPYHGTTTTCEALSMGVPVVSMVGTRHVSRVGKTILEAVGHPEWVAEDWSGYIDRAVAIAEDGDSRRRWRTSLREELQASPLADPDRLASAFGDAIRQAWVEWCENPR